MIAQHADLPALLKVFGDSNRLRILGVLELEELTVGELARTLGQAQSRVSNHLRVLREHGLLAERRVGASVHLRSGVADQEAYAVRLWGTLREGLASLPEHGADRTRLQQVLAARQGDGVAFFDRVAGEWDKIGSLFASGQARQRTVANLLPAGLVLADLGCGTGYMARALAPLARRLICVDASEGMLEEARANLSTTPAGVEVEFRPGTLDALPIADGELDGAVLGMVLHHLPELGPALREVHRALRPGGTLAVLELAPHREDWTRTALGDRHLGLEAGDVVAALRRAGFEDLHSEAVDDRYEPTNPDAPEEGRAALPLYIVRGRRAARA